MLVIAEESQGGGNLRRHHPRKRMIQYAERYEFFIGACDYWIPAFAGHDGLRLPRSLCLDCQRVHGTSEFP